MRSIEIRKLLCKNYKLKQSLKQEKRRGLCDNYEKSMMILRKNEEKLIELSKSIQKDQDLVYKCHKHRKFDLKKYRKDLKGLKKELNDVADEIATMNYSDFDLEAMLAAAIRRLENGELDEEDSSPF